MLKKKNVLKFILGLKIRQLRARKKISLKDLADRTALSSSYLNEIENGKKYPKVEKLAGIAEALEIPFEELISFKTGRNLHPLLTFLEGDMVGKVPLDILGLYESDVVELMGKDPEKFASFVLTVLQLSRSFNMKLDDLYRASLRSYIELNDNYFPEIERLAKKYRAEFFQDSMSPEILERHLRDKFNVQVDYDQIINSSFKDQIHFYFNSDSKKLFLNARLQHEQRKFYLAKILGQCLLKIELQTTNGFTEKVMDFKSSYFSNALLVDEKEITKDVKAMFSSAQFAGANVLESIKRFDVTPELYFHRLTQILPTHLKAFEIFFLAMSQEDSQAPVVMNKELHLSQLHRPHGVRMNETYCKRWVAVRSIEGLKLKATDDEHVSAQISQLSDEIEYFSLSLAKRSRFKSEKIQSYTIGFLINNELKKTLKFLNERSLPKLKIGQTCERCSITTCAERAAPPVIYDFQKMHQDKEYFLSELQ